MTNEIVIAALQMDCGKDQAANLDHAESLVREAAASGAKIILPPELFETRYFCQDQIAGHFDLASAVEDNPAVARFRKVAADCGIVVPVSFFERAGQSFFNSVAIVDADGSVLGVYRKSHIPDGPGYTEKFYFSPGDTGFRVWNTAHARIGVGICWDQWFPEAARAMALKGAEILLYPTAIGSEPQDTALDSRDHWQRVMQGHAGANLMPLIASNRTGVEPGAHGTSIKFYGSSFIADHQGAKLTEAGREGDAVLTATIDLGAIAATRASWGVFRDRRPELYEVLGSYDGVHRHAAAG
ncbi:MAG TPA: N-carbamoylputrescine amidase [Acidiphilium sp.]